MLEETSLCWVFILPFREETQSGIHAKISQKWRQTQLQAGLAPCQPKQGAPYSLQHGVHSQLAESAESRASTVLSSNTAHWDFGCENSVHCVEVFSEHFSSADNRIYLLSSLDRACGMCNCVLSLGKYSVMNDYYFALCLWAGFAVFRLWQNALFRFCSRNTYIPTLYHHRRTYTQTLSLLPL